MGSALHELADREYTLGSLRNATAFGFAPRLRADIVLNNLIGYALLTGEVLVKSDGTPWRPLVHAADIADVFAAALVAPAETVQGRALHVGAEAHTVPAPGTAPTRRPGTRPPHRPLLVG